MARPNYKFEKRRKELEKKKKKELKRKRKQERKADQIGEEESPEEISDTPEDEKENE